MARAYNSRQYRRYRLAVLEAAGWRCQIRAPGCLGWASQADHITPVAMGGTNDLANLRAACSRCNARGGLIVQVRRRQARQRLRAASRRW